MDTIGKRLRAARERKGWTVDRLALETLKHGEGIVPRTIEYIEGGSVSQDPRTKTTVALALALGVPVEWLATGMCPPSDIACDAKAEG